ncbi:MAG: nitrile hydratase subunit beta [Acidobacteria bacterium]|nr:MAG: nitrile hydratase subunit beta [Acidobacteriota bacterium]
MDGIHDLGGRQGFGAVRRDTDERLFHSRWEERAFACVELLLGKGRFDIDEFRHAIERLEPVEYLTAGYYGRWLAAIELLLRESGEEPGRSEALSARQRRPGSRREVDRAPRFSVGDRVRARHLVRSGHCRLPAYVRGRRGEVVEVHPAYVYPDTSAARLGDHPQYVYSVLFDGRELWGDEAERGTSVSVDLFEPYLEDGGADPATPETARR